MPSNSKKKGPTKSELRSIRMQQIIFLTISIIIILAMVLSLVAKY